MRCRAAASKRESYDQIHAQNRLTPSKLAENLLENLLLFSFDAEAASKREMRFKVLGFEKWKTDGFPHSCGLLA